jgi:hypothetical protein
MLKIKTPKLDVFKIRKLPKLNFLNTKFVSTVYTIAFIALALYTYQIHQKNIQINSFFQSASQEKNSLENKLSDTQKKYDEVRNEDQYVKNNTLEDEIKNIQNTYKKAAVVYESLLDLKNKTKDTGTFDETLANIFTLLSQRNYIEASSKLDMLASDIKKKESEISSSFKIPENVTSSNSPPTSGYQRQKVQTDSGSFMVDIVSADLSSTKVIVDTVSDSDCGNNCPVLPLADYIKRNNAYAGVNGTYFCPSTYPSCSGKTNSFDLLLMNYKKTYFNSGNNVYSSNPAVIFGDGYIRFVSQASEWGRDTSPNGVLSNYPLLLLNGEIRFSGDGDEKKTSRGGRSFVASKGNNVYIGVVFSATVAESAKALKSLEMENAINLDDGGSTALWYGGYKAGPGRNIPNAILFIKK